MPLWSFFVWPPLSHLCNQSIIPYNMYLTTPLTFLQKSSPFLWKPTNCRWKWCVDLGYVFIEWSVVLQLYKGFGLSLTEKFLTSKCDFHVLFCLMWWFVLLIVRSFPSSVPSLLFFVLFTVLPSPWCRVSPLYCGFNLSLSWWFSYCECWICRLQFWLFNV